jgi:hypothetical protein
MVGGALLGLALGLIKKPYYMSQMTLSHIRFNNHFCYEQINNLQSFISESDHVRTQLRKNLSLSLPLARQIKAIKYMPLNVDIAHRYRDSSNMLLPFKIEVDVYCDDVLDSLQIGILNYLEANAYALQQKKTESMSLDKAEKRLEQEIESLDSLKRLLHKTIIPQSKGQGIILGEPINPVLVYETSMKLYEQKLRINERQLHNDSFSVVVGFSKSVDAGWGKLSFIVIGLLTGYIIGLIYLLRQDKRKGTGTVSPA